MGNVLDYLRWRGDLPISRVPLGEVDALILAEISMLRWENAPRGAGSLRELAGDVLAGPVSAGFLPEMDEKLLRLVGASERFGGAEMGERVFQVDEAAGMQFAAVSLRLDDGTRFLSFRGTDNTIVGWKEDFSMAFSRPVPAQEAAREYVERLAAQSPEPLVLGGHSKGGNLAIYAAATVSDAARERIRAVYNFDGPGLSDHIDAQSLYARLSGRLHSYVPQGSIVGLLLAHPDEYAVVRSTAVGILQHDPYSWQVEGPAFERMSGLTPDSARFDTAFRAWLLEMDDSDRALLVNTLFGILSATNAQTFGPEFWAGLAQNTKAVRGAIDTVEPETRKRIRSMISELRKLARRA